ncbi:MAG: YiiX/YebB-like N1pC/P60 family cysteine hydrolase [Cocleimonas sp.]
MQIIIKSNLQIRNTRRAYYSLCIALEDFKKEQPDKKSIENAVRRGHFLPEEDDRLWSRVSRYLTIRSGFWEIINEMSHYFSDNIQNVKSEDDWKFFLFGYAASCQVVNMARLLVDELAKDKLIQRKINEGSPQNRIPRKVFTTIFASLSDTDNAIKMQYMMNFVEANRDYINALSNDQDIGEVIQHLEDLESNLHSSQLAFIKLRFCYLWHAIKRRFAVSKQATSFFVLEQAGRVIADIGDHQNKRVTEQIYAKIEKLLLPGDVIVTRHDLVASNLFLPGYWPHCALYIGSEQQRDALGITLDSEILKRWSGNIRTLEAKKDGVLFRSSSETFEVDEFVIIRPQLTDTQLTEALTRVVQHEGKGYNFDFDFFRSDQLVCTEVIYRAFDNIGDINFTLIERAGRLSLSAEDILDLAVKQQGFQVVAVFGFEGCKDSLITDKSTAAKLLKDSY